MRVGWGGLWVLRLPASSCLQVPIIPVVYSSFSSFYNSRTKLFTSGSAPTTCAHTRDWRSLVTATPGPP